MERIPGGRYTKEFRLEAVDLIIEGKWSAAEVSCRLIISDNTLPICPKCSGQERISEYSHSGSARLP